MNKKKKNLILFESKQFIIRPFQKTDAEDLAKNINDKTISRNTATIPHPYKLKDAKEWLDRIAKKSSEKCQNFAIVIDNEVVGAVGLDGIVKEHKAEIGYWIAKKYWGKGFVSEAVKIVSDFGFKELKLKRIWGGVYFFNPASKRVLEKNGFKLEGIQRKYVKRGGKFFDAWMMAKIK